MNHGRLGLLALVALRCSQAQASIDMIVTGPNDRYESGLSIIARASPDIHVQGPPAMR